MEERYLRVKEVATMLSMSRSNIWRLMKFGDFPKSIKVGPSMTLWKASEIHAWVESRQKFESDR